MFCSLDTYVLPILAANAHGRKARVRGAQRNVSSPELYPGGVAVYNQVDLETDVENTEDENQGTTEMTAQRNLNTSNVQPRL